MYSCSRNSLIILTKCCKKIESRTPLIRWLPYSRDGAESLKQTKIKLKQTKIKLQQLRCPPLWNCHLRRPWVKRSVKCVTSVFSFSFTKISREDFKFIHSSRCFQNASFSATDSPGVLWMEGLTQLTFSLPWPDCWFSHLAATHFLVRQLGEFDVRSRWQL